MSLKINKYLEEISKKLEESENFFYIFRGQPSKDYDLDCTAVRPPKNTAKTTKHRPHHPLSADWLRSNQKRIIGDIKMKGLGYQKGLSDLEILADLRHYGAPSCLIDFTSDFLIALWFACQKNDNKNYHNNGKVFVLNCYETDKFSKISSKNINEDVDCFIDDNHSFPSLWYWVPERFNQRLADQDAVFVFGKPKIEENDYESIEVEENHKEEILEELERFFDYSRKTLFSDKYAIGENYKDIDANSSEYLLEESIHHIQTNDLDYAKASLEKITNPEDSAQIVSEAYFQLAYVQMRTLKANIGKIKNTKEKSKEAKKHIDFLSAQSISMDSEPDYIKNFNHCASRRHKKEKIEQIKNNFMSFLQDMNPDME